MSKWYHFRFNFGFCKQTQLAGKLQLTIICVSIFLNSNAEFIRENEFTHIFWRPTVEHTYTMSHSKRTITLTEYIKFEDHFPCPLIKSSTPAFGQLCDFDSEANETNQMMLSDVFPNSMSLFDIDDVEKENTDKRPNTTPYCHGGSISSSWVVFYAEG